MKFTLSWLQEHLETNLKIEEIADKLTNIGLEVEELKSDKSDFIVSRIIEVRKHHNADNLNICMVDNGKEILQIVCGAHNVRVGMKCVLAKIGSVIPSTGATLTKLKILGVESNGMLCSASELKIGNDHDGIVDLGDNVEVGENFFKIDPVIEIAITPNRGDCLGVRGVARDLSATGIGELKSLTLPSINFNAIESPIKVRVDDTNNCSCFIGCYINGVKNGPSPGWMQERLKAAEINPQSILVDISNYLSLTFNRPMHIYDADKLSGDLVVRLAKKDECFQALDRKKYILDESITVIADKEEAQAIAGIIGGINSGCSLETSNVFLEIAMFNRISIGASSRRVGITTDSSYRFERGLDSASILDDAKIAINMITCICGGEPSHPIVIDNTQTNNTIIPFDLQKLKKITGCNLDERRSREIIGKLGFTIEGNNLLVPSWRNDIEGVADIAEEILRIDGYNNIPSNPFPIIDKKQNFNVSSLNGEMLTIRGMYEVITWSFMDSKQIINNDDTNIIEIKNPISENLNVMRPSILPNLIDVMESNFSRDEIGVAIFEIGLIYLKNKNEKVVSGLRSGFVNKKNIYSINREYDMFDVKADVLAILQQYNIDSPKLINNAPKYYHPGRSGCVVLGKTVLAYFGELIERKKHRIMVFEVFVERIPKIKKKRQRHGFSVYQSVNRDFAFVVKEEVNIGTMISVILASDKFVIQEVDVFDIYRGPDIGENNKSVGISVRLQAQDKTLSGDDIEKVDTKIIENIENKCCGVLRRDYL